MLQTRISPLSETTHTAPHCRIVVLVPCLNEEKTVGKVITDLRAAIPDAEIVVFDNASTDCTGEVARKNGAKVMVEKRRGKGLVIQSMFQKIEADYYIMIDGDDTYPANRVMDLLTPVMEGDADMVVGSRMMENEVEEFRIVNLLGNKFYLQVINGIFGTHFTDILSGYRCMNRRLVKGLPLFVSGFEIEAELTIKALERGFQILEVPVHLRARPDGSHSKIRIVQDGLRILITIFALFRDYKPLTFFGAFGLIVLLFGVGFGISPLVEYFNSGVIHNIPEILLSIGTGLTGVIILAIGVILHTLDRRFQELEYYMRQNLSK